MQRIIIRCRRSIRATGVVVLALGIGLGISAGEADAAKAKLAAAIETLAKVGPLLIEIAKIVWPGIAIAADSYEALQKARLTAGDSCTVPLTCATRSDIDAKLKKLSGDTISAMVPAEISSSLSQLETAQDQLKGKFDALADLERKVASAPDGVDFYDFINSTKADYVKRKGVLEAEVKTQSAELDRKREQIAGFFMTKTGISLSADEIADLTSFPSGIDYLKSIVFVAVARAVDHDLQKKLSGATSVAEIARQYDTQAFLLRVYVDNFETLLARYDQTWLPKVSTMRAELEQMAADFGGKAKSSKLVGNREVFNQSKNAAVGALLDVKNFEVQLTAQRNGVAAALGDANETVDAANSQLRVLKTIADLADLKRQAKAANAMFSRLSLPEFRAVAVGKQRVAFGGISAKIMH